MTPTPPSLCRRAVVVLLALVVVMQAPPAATATGRERLPVLVVGDSLCVGARDNGGDMTATLRGHGWEPEYACEIGRPLAWGIDQVRRLDRVPHTVVVALGTNGGDTEAGFDVRLAMMRSALVERGAIRIVWVDYATSIGGYPTKNHALHRFAAAHGDAVVAWSLLSAGGANLFHADGLHHSPEGKVRWVAGIAAALGEAGPFADVSTGIWFGPAVSWASERAITTGFGDSGLFLPHRSVTRAEAVTFMWRAAGMPATDGPTFVDVPAGAYFESAVRWAAANGITTGVGSTGRFEPDRTASRAEMVTFLWRAAEHPPSAPRSFADTDPAAFYSAAVSWAVEQVVTTGVGSTGTFQPHRDVTRAEALTFVWRSSTR